MVHSGSDYFRLLEEIIDNSVRSLHLQTYIFETDATGRRIIDALKRAVARGVRVVVLADAFGSFPFDRHIAKEMKEAGILFRLFSPLFSTESIFFARRLHHKIVVSDELTAMIGGINIADKYYGGDETAWLDYAVYLRGDLCAYLHALCEQLYARKKPLILSEKQENKKMQGVRFRRNDWIRRRDEIYHSYAESICNAKNSIVIVASYFLPGSRFRRMLKQAAARGVKVMIILAGASDIGSLRLAENYLYDFYLSNNMEIYEWRNSVMHGKAMLVDEAWATIGSYNLNYLSRYISIELNADVMDKAFVEEFSKHLKFVMETECTHVQSGPFKKRNGWMRVKTWLAYYFYRALLGFMMRGKRYREKR